MDIIFQCVSSVSFAVLVNGDKSEIFRPVCGLRQGEPLSSYLFILVSQVLSSPIAFLNNLQICRGVAISSKSPRISHLVFLG